MRQEGDVRKEDINQNKTHHQEKGVHMWEHVTAEVREEKKRGGGV